MSSARCPCNISSQPFCSTTGLEQLRLGEPVHLLEGDHVGGLRVEPGLGRLHLGSIEEAGFFGSMWDGMKLWADGLFEDDESESDTGSE